MCTVTFVPTAGGYRLGMNRDERHGRALGLPPAVRDLEGTLAVFPSEPSAGSRDWLRRLHRSHRPARGAHSTCVHRADAGTVSYTEVEVEARRVRVGYVAGPPCRGTQPVGVETGCDGGAAQRVARSTTAQAMRSPALPAGSVR